jgi:molecular chaperone DnaJ
LNRASALGYHRRAAARRHGTHEGARTTVNVDESYRELGLKPGSSDAEVKAAWRRLAARWHPDRNRSPLAPGRIQRINRALEEIRRYRASSFGPLTENGFPFDIGPAPAAATATREVEQAIRLTLEEAIAGCIRELEGELVDGCVACAATGLQRHATACPDCGGTGRVRQPLWFLWAGASAPCKTCRGRGELHQRCRACDGSGQAPARRYRCRARIPAGVREGDLLHVAAELHGHHASEKLALSLRVELVPHELFTIDTDGTVRCELPVDGFAWIANRWIEVPTPAGLQQMRLKRGYHTYRIKGQGFPGGEAGERADVIVTVAPLFPEAFSKAQDAQIERLVASNTKAGGTPAGRRVAAWQQALQQWQERVGRKGD